MLKHSTFIALASMAAQLTVAALYVVVARSGGPSQLGQIVTIVAMANFTAGVINFGTNNYWVREVARGALDSIGLSNNIACKLFYSFIFTVLLAVALRIIFHNQIYFFTGIMAFTIAMHQTLQVPLKAHSLGYKVSFIVISERAIAAIVFFALLFVGVSSHLSILLALTTGSLISGGIAVAIWPARSRQKFVPSRLIWPWRGVTSHGIGNITIAAQTLDATILYAVAGPVATGVYGAVNRWTQPLSVFAAAFATAGLPIVAKNKSIKAAYPALKRSWWLLGIAAASCVLVAAFSAPIVKLLLGSQYADSASVLAVLALGTIPALLNQPLYVFLQAMHAEKFTAIHLVVAVFMQLLLCGILAHYLAEMGAAIAMLCAQSYLLVGFIVMLVKFSSK